MRKFSDYIATIEGYLADDPLAWDSFSLAVVVAPTSSPFEISEALNLTPVEGEEANVSFERLVDLALAEGGADDGGPAWLIQQRSLVALLQPNDFVVGHAVTVELATGRPAVAVHRNEAKAFNSLSVRPSRGRDAMYFELDELMELGVQPHQQPYLSDENVAAIEQVRAEISGEVKFIAAGLAIVALTTGFRLTPELLGQSWPAVMATPSSRFE